MEQQKSAPSHPGHAQTYLYLGNLHEQRGNLAKARQVWQQGLRLFPNNKALRKKLQQ